MKKAQMLVVLALLSGTAVFLFWRGDADLVPGSTPLSELPHRIADWYGEDLPMKGYVLDVLGKGTFLNRSYAVGRAGEPPDLSAPIGLFIAYFPTQRTGQAIHSPQNCLPGAGWTFDAHRVITLKDELGKSVEVGEYEISNGNAHDEVLYWYRSHGRSMAGDYTAKWFTLLDSVRYRRTDAALIRVITSVGPDESQQAAHNRAVKFAQHLNPLLPSYIPD